MGVEEGGGVKTDEGGRGTGKTRRKEKGRTSVQE